MASDREFVVVEDLAKYDDVRLAEVIGALEEESAEVLAELRVELQQRTIAALERAAKAGVTIGASMNSDVPAPKGAKRGRKSKEEQAAIDAAKAEAEAKQKTNGHVETLSTVVPAEISRQ